MIGGICSIYSSTFPSQVAVGAVAAVAPLGALRLLVAAGCFVFWS